MSEIKLTLDSTPAAVAAEPAAMNNGQILAPVNIMLQQRVLSVLYFVPQPVEADKRSGHRLSSPEPRDVPASGTPFNCSTIGDLLRIVNSIPCLSPGVRRFLGAVGGIPVSVAGSMPG